MLALAAALGPVLLNILGKFIDDKEQLETVHQQLMAALMTFLQTTMQASSSVMAADAASNSWLTRNARPIVVLWTLCLITTMAFSPFLGHDLQHALLDSVKAIPADLWDLVKVGIGGYMLARTADKAITAWQQGK